MPISGLWTSLRAASRPDPTVSPPAPVAPPTAAGVLASVLACSLSLGALPLVLLVSGLYFATPPKGDKAMIIVVPMGASILAGLAYVVAGWIVLARRGLEWLRPCLPRLPGALAIVTTLATAGVGLGMFFSVITWANRFDRWGAAVLIIGWLLGTITPGVLSGLLVRSSIAPGRGLTRPLGVCAGWIGLAAVGGWMLLGYALFAP
ncbi:MAG: hypothetical protein K2Q20_07255 [Phycisphaerales bacterium]|nr:hypothetical protein [Phycisphaerales bacterium]